MVLWFIWVGLAFIELFINLVVFLLGSRLRGFVEVVGLGFCGRSEF